MQRGAEQVVPRVTLGCAVFGGIGSLSGFVGRGESRQSAFDLMNAAWSAGIQTFDTADAYGAGASERWIGEWIRQTGRRPRIITKTFNPVGDSADSGLSRERLVRQVHASLERLDIDQIDVYLAHEYDRATPVAESFSAFEGLVDDGLISEYGVSNFSAPQLEEVLSVSKPAVIQNSYSLLNRRDETDVIPVARAHGVAYQAYSPLAGGWLSGKYRRHGSVADDSRLSVAPQWYTHIDPERAFDALDRMTELAGREGVALSVLAHGWVLAQPFIDGIVVGPRRIEHLGPILAAQELPLSQGVDAELSAIFA